MHPYGWPLAVHVGSPLQELRRPVQVGGPLLMPHVKAPLMHCTLWGAVHVGGAPEQPGPLLVAHVKAPLMHCTVWGAVHVGGAPEQLGLTPPPHT